EVVECYYTTGQYDLLIKVFARNNKDLLHIIHNKLQPIGLSRTETLVSFKEAFRKKLPINVSK
ncbi:MAG TPA: transcriptional regulator, partial [Porphyromonadaceae bacterium]|nr:transcriptional regulator [Porphyromonadaceae bacterium]